MSSGLQSPPSDISDTGPALSPLSPLLTRSLSPLPPQNGNSRCRRLVDRLHRLRTLMKESPLTVLRLRTKSSPKISEVIEQAKILCEDYVYDRLLRSGVLRDVERAAVIDEMDKLSDVSREIQLIGTKLETTYPTLYRNVSRQVNIPFKTDTNVRRTMTAVGDFLFKHGVVTWCRIVALFAIAAAVSTECVQNGHADYIGTVVTVCTEVIERHAAHWISKQGGWAEVLKAFRVSRDTRNLWVLTGIGTLAGFIFTWITAMQI